MKPRTTILSAILTTALFIAPGCGQGDRPGGKSRRADTRPTIRLAGGDWGYPTPYTHYPRGPGGFKMCLIFDSLLERGPDGLIPWLAESWTIGDDGRVYRFDIREGITWHDGKPLTAEDVAFSFMYASQHPMVWSSIETHDIQNCHIDPPGTVVVKAHKPTASLLYRLGRTRILPKHIWNAIDRPREFTGKGALIGSGPFRLTHYNRAQGIYRFEAFPGFWGPRPAVAGIEFVPVSQDILAFENGTIDLAQVPPDLVPRFEGKPGLKLVRSPGFWGYRMMFNPSRVQILAQPAFRQALACAVDRRELVAKVARGAAVPGSLGILPPDHRLHNPDVRGYPHNPEAARNLVRKAQAAMGRQNARGETAESKTIQLALLVSNRNREIRLATLIGEHLKAAGVSLTIRSCDAKTRDAKVRDGDYDLAIIGHGGWGSDPDYLYERFCSTGSSLSPAAYGANPYMSDELAEALAKLHTEPREPRRRELAFAAQQMLASEVLELPLYYTTGYVVYRAAKYDGWTFIYDHHSMVHGKLSYLSGWRR